MNLIITSEQRVGSRWMHYLFADLLGKSPSPEIGGHRFYSGEHKKIISLVKNYLSEERIPKFHGVGAIVLNRFLQEAGLKDFGILGVVRNPYDRAVSVAFHNRYHKVHDFKQKKFDTDREAVVWTASKDTGFKKSCVRQYSDLMLPHYSTFSNWRPDIGINYVWTTYDWLKKDTAGEIQTILRTLFLGETIPRTQHIEKFVELHSFKKRSGRKVGEEKRNDLWHRKGTRGDYKNWFNDDCYHALEPYQFEYIYRKEREFSGKIGGIPVI